MNDYTPEEKAMLQRRGVRRLKVYYAHCLAIYSTVQEARDILTLEQLGFEVVNPNNPDVNAAFQTYKAANPDSYMEFFKGFATTCDAVAFRPLPGGRIPGGVGKEVNWFRAEGKPVIELPSFIDARIMTHAETVVYLKEAGQR